MTATVTATGEVITETIIATVLKENEPPTITISSADVPGVVDIYASEKSIILVNVFDANGDELIWGLAEEFRNASDDSPKHVKVVAVAIFLLCLVSLLNQTRAYNIGY